MNKAEQKYNPDKVTVYYYDVSPVIDDCLFEHLCSLLEDTDRRLISSITNKSAKVTRLWGRLMMREIAKQEGLDLYNYSGISQTGKPFLKSHHPIGINISHSGQMVVCCMSSLIFLGIDIELVRPIKIDQYAPYFQQEEMELINSSASPIEAFFKAWTRKEAIIKADGRGFQLNTCDFSCTEDEVVFENKTWFLEEVNVAQDYCCSIAYERLPQIELINFADLFELPDIL